MQGRLNIEKVAMIDFKGAHYPSEVILYAVFFYVRYGVSYRDLEEIMAERGVSGSRYAQSMGCALLATDC